MDQALSDSQFVDLLTSSQVRLRSFALTLAPCSSDADDLVQNACLTIWEKRRDYDPSRAFFSWACGFLVIEVLRFRRRTANDRLMFDEALINALAADYVAHVGEYDLRRQQLHACLAKLSKKDRDLLEERYSQNSAPKQISKRRGLPLTTVYSALSRIREALHQCIRAHLAQQAHPEIKLD